MEPLGQLADPDPSPPQPPAGGQAPPDRIVGGVAGLIADRLGVDALWVRIGFVVLALAGGIGVIVYAGCWLALVAGAWSRPLRLLGGALLVAGVPILLSARSDGGFITGPLAVALLLAGLALALWQPRRARTAPATSAPWSPPAVGPDGAPRHGSGHAGAPTSPNPAGPGGTGPSTDPLWSDAAAPDGWSAAGSWPSTQPRTERWPRRTGLRRRREPSVLGRATLGAAAVVGAGWALADQLDGGRLHPEQWLGAAAAVCGIGMLVGAFAGRARWLIVPAVALAGTGYVVGTTARMDIPAGDLFGDRYVSAGPYSAGDVSERVGIGSIHLGIDGPFDRPFDGAPLHVDVRAGIGNIVISVPDNVTVELHARVDHGSIRSSQRGSLGDRSVTVLGDGEPSVIVDAWVGRGDIDVTEWIIGDAPVATTLPLLPSGEQPTSGTLVPVRPGVAMTTDGWVVLGDGAALISPDGEVTGGGTFPDGGYSSGYPDGAVYPAPDGGAYIDTAWGQFRLLPRDLLLTPEQEVIDLRAIRAELASTTTTSATVGPATVTPSATDPSLGATPSTFPRADATTTTITPPDDGIAVTTLPGADAAGG